MFSQPVQIIIKTIDDKEPSWPDIENCKGEGNITSMAILEKGTVEGRASVAFRVEDASRQFVFAQLTAGQLEMLAAALKGAELRFADLEKQR